MGKIEESNQGHFFVSGILSFNTVTQVLRHSKKLFEQASNDLIIDLSEVERADSAGLALLVEWFAVATTLNKTLVFNNVPEQLVILARMSSVDKMLSIGQ